MARYRLPDLPYDYNALEPVIFDEIMQIHHQNHHQGYVNNLNAALEKAEEAEKREDLDALIVHQASIRFNGGGHLNHSLFWENLAPMNRGGGEKPEGELLKAIEKEFGQFGALVDLVNEKTIAVQGSGWGWLGFDKERKHLVVTTSPIHDVLLLQGLTPLLVIDVWEHAYYL